MCVEPISMLSLYLRARVSSAWRNIKVVVKSCDRHVELFQPGFHWFSIGKGDVENGRDSKVRRNLQSRCPSSVPSATPMNQKVGES